MNLSQSLKDLLGKEEDLCEELAIHISEVEGLGPVLQHPLVYAVPYFEQMNALYNAQLVAKQDRLSAHLENGEFTSYIFMHERPHRVDALRRVRDNIAQDPRCYWKTVAEVYVDTENLWQNTDTWRWLLQGYAQLNRHRHHLMTAEERAFLKDLPDELTVYRGWSEEFGNQDSFAWTLSYEIAEWFAKRFRRNGHVAKKHITKSQVVAYFNRRSEEEILLLP